MPLVAHHVKLEKAGRDWKGCCPFHAEKTPSFHVYEDGHYHCFGCRAHGDTIEWLIQGEGLTFNDAVLQLAGYAGIRAPDGTRRQETAAERAVREANIAREQAEQQRIRDAEIAAELAEELDKARAIIAETVDWGRHGGTGTRRVRSPRPRPIAPPFCAGIRPSAPWSRSPPTPPAYRHPVR